MENKTAVDWLWDNMKSHFEHDGDLLEAVKMSFDIAKEKEKHQIIKARLGVGHSFRVSMGLVLEAEKYYDELYEDSSNLAD